MQTGWKWTELWKALLKRKESGYTENVCPDSFVILPPKKKLSTILSTKKMSYEQNTNCNSSICHVFCNYSDSWSIWIQNKVNCFYSKHRFNVIKINGQNENRQRTVRKKSSVERNCLWRSIYYRSTRLYVLTFLITSSTIKIKR